MPDGMTEQTPRGNWRFAPAYHARFGSLPESQQREAEKRLTRRARNPLAAEKLCEESLDVEECLTALFSAYSNKKERARVASAAKRAIDRLARVKLGLATAADADAPADVEVEAEAAMIPQALWEEFGGLTLQPAIVVCGGESEAPAPEPAALPRLAAKRPPAIVTNNVPATAPAALQPAAAAAPAVREKAASVLNAMLRRF